MPSLSREITHGSDQSRKILQQLKDRVRFWERIANQKFAKWKDAEERSIAFLPEREIDAKRRTSRDNGLPQYTTIQIPYSYAVMMSAHTYLTSVFMGRSPIFQFSGRHGESQQQVQGIEALVDYQVMVGQIAPYMYTWIYDAMKYGNGIVGIYWEDRYDAITTITEQQEVDPFGLPTGKTSKLQQTQLFRKYSGNTLYSIQPQYFVWDARYPMAQFQKGEFAGRRLKMGWNELTRRAKQGYYFNIDNISKSTSGEWSMPDQGSPELARPETLSSNQDWTDIYTFTEPRRPMMVDLYELVVECSQKEWGLGQLDWPEKWVFTFTSDFNTLIGVQPLGALHSKYPYMVLSLEPEAYSLTNRGYPEILEPVQNTVDWLLNSHFYNVRAALNNTFVVDPSRLVMKDVLDPLPGGIIRLRPEAYGQDTKTAMSQMQVQDVTRTHMADLPAMIGIGERTAGVNDQMMGLLGGGGSRKTATEVRTSTSFGVNRLKTVAEFMSCTAMDPLSQILVSNTQQYYDMELQFKIAGDLMMSAGPGFLNVTPDLIAGFYNFVPVDGTLPIDRMAQVNLWKDLFQSLLTVPMLGMQYDLAGIFQWVAQLAGLKNISQFRVQVAPDQLLMAQMQSGNVIPMNGLGPKGQAGANAAGTQQGQRALPVPAGRSMAA